MTTADSVIAVFPDHEGADAAIKALAADGFNMRDLSLVGKGYHTEEKVIGFYTVGDRVAFWGSRGAFWGGLWGMFFSGAVLTIPLFGQVIVLGTLAAMLIAAAEGAVVAGGVSALVAALYSLNVPKNSVVEYEAALKSDGFLVMAHGSPERMERARTLLEARNPRRLDIHGKSTQVIETAIGADLATV